MGRGRTGRRGGGAGPGRAEAGVQLGGVAARRRGTSGCQGSCRGRCGSRAACQRGKGGLLPCGP
eukprot:11185142-Lingulodinium_polyedra.AAC.1